MNQWPLNKIEEENRPTMNEKKNARRKNKVYFYSSMPRVTQTLAVSF